MDSFLLNICFIFITLTLEPKKKRQEQAVPESIYWPIAHTLFGIEELQYECGIPQYFIILFVPIQLSIFIII